MRTIEAFRRIIVFDSVGDMHAFAARRWAGLCREAIADHGLFAAAVSGGSTPEGFYRMLADVPGLPWDRTHLFLADERFVLPSDPDSNFRLLRESLLARITIPEENLHPVPTDGDSAAAAVSYERLLRGFFRIGAGEFPRFDLVMLGLGQDGHTASLFPGIPELKEGERLVCAVEEEHVRHARITLTLSAINHSSNAIFLVTGGGKAEALYEVAFQGNEGLPASHVALQHGDVVFLADAAAARLLPEGG